MPALASPSAVLRSLVATVVLLVVFISLGSILGNGLALLGLVIWLLVLSGVAVGAFLILQAGRPVAGLGAIVTAISLLLAFFIPPQPMGWMLWTAVFFIGVVLVAAGTKRDTLQRSAWPAILVRAGVGWGLVDSAQDHFWNFWLSGAGGSFSQQTTAAANRAPLWFLDPAYQSFLQSTAVANPDLWASLTICGGLAFGTMLAIGLFTPIGAIGAIWQNMNYVLLKGMVAHGAYFDKVFIAGELFSLVALAGLAYGLDSVVSRYLPASVAQILTNASGEETAAGSPLGAARAGTT